MAVSEANMVVLLVFTVIFVSFALAIQVAMILWRKCHPRSFDIATFCALSCKPPVFAYMTSSWWFIIFWAIFFSISTVAFLKALQRPLLSSTPGLIFIWFYLVHNCSFLLWMVGSMAFLIGFFTGVSWLTNFGILCTLYAVYFGLVGGDFAMLITDNLFLKPGVNHTGQILPIFFADPLNCSLCGHLVSSESRCIISCDHTYHQHCIRGWHMIGKKSTCPVCREKVDYRFDRNPWETPDEVLQIYHKFIRWLVVYLPMFLLAFGILYKVL
ncbi:RING finger protein 121-like [Daphnia pulex]|uniref:RING finger protein 121-like n=1 Tax=Daphnia pulex TaxID=6669 RepID=UPI001EDEFF2F|nr:RING finger protein 121-like [Daphnia pulex]